MTFNMLSGHKVRLNVYSNGSNDYYFVTFIQRECLVLYKTVKNATIVTVSIGHWDKRTDYKMNSEISLIRHSPYRLHWVSVRPRDTWIRFCKRNHLFWVLFSFSLSFSQGFVTLSIVQQSFHSSDLIILKGKYRCISTSKSFYVCSFVWKVKLLPYPQTHCCDFLLVLPY